MNIGFLASHNGSNMQAIIDACKSGILKSRPAVIISNNKDSGAISRAKREGIPYYHLSSKTHPAEEDLDQAILDSMIRHDADIVILAGYMKKLGPKILTHFKNAILNIHPALLPSFKGMHAHEDAIAYGVKISGVTVHFVDIHEDHGPIIIQHPVPVYDTDTKDTLSPRILEWEHKAFPKAIELFCDGRLTIDGRIVRIQGEVKL